MEFIVQILNGMSVGSIYALVALGYSMVYGIVKLINFAHGEIIMLGGYAIYVSTLLLGLPVWLSVILSIAFCAIVGVAIEKLAYNRLLRKNAPRISLLITAIGVSIFLQNLMAQEWAFGSGSKPVNKLFNIPDLEIGGLKIEMLTVVTVLTTALLTVLLQLLVSKTKLGKAMRAASEDAGAAKLMGINTSVIIAATFAIGSALAAVGALFYCEKYMQINPFMGSMLGLKAFVAAVLGGIGSIPGAVVGGLALGIAESVTIALGGSAFSDAVVFGALILVLVIRPAGLFGKNLHEKV